MKKRDAFDSLLAAAGADPFKFGPKSMNQIKEQQQKQQSVGLTSNIAVTQPVVQQQPKPAVQQQPDYLIKPVKKHREPSIDISGLEDLDTQSGVNAINQQANADIFDVFLDVGAMDIPSQRSNPESQSFNQSPSEAIGIQEKLEQSQEVLGQMHLSKSTPNIQHVEAVVKQQTSRETVSTPPTPPNELEDNNLPPSPHTVDHADTDEFQNVVLPSQARRQSITRDSDGLKNMWNGFTNSAKNFSKNISKKMNEFVATPPLSEPPKSPSISERNRSSPQQTQPIIQEYQEFLAIAVAKMPSEEKRKTFISKLEQDDREAVLTVFREQRCMESQISKSYKESQQQRVTDTNIDSNSKEDFITPNTSETVPSNLVEIKSDIHIPTKQTHAANSSQSVPSNLVDINSDIHVPSQQTHAGNMYSVMDDAPLTKSFQAPQKGGNNPQDLFSFDNEISDNPGHIPFVDNNELLGMGGYEEGLVIGGGDLMDLEDEQLMQLVNQKCEELAVPGEPRQRKELRRIRLIQEAKKVQEKMLWKQEMEAREQQATEDKLRVKDEIREEIKQWKNESTGIQGYLCNLHKVLWEGADWKPVPLSELLEPSKVKKFYLKAQLVVHPDKVNQKFDGNPPPEIAARADMIADILKESMAKFS